MAENQLAGGGEVGLGGDEDTGGREVAAQRGERGASSEREASSERGAVAKRGKKPKRGATTLNGILLVDKPAGMTSHDVVNQVRELSAEGRVGHCGTLDPAATGLLIVCVGPATKLAALLSAADKDYLAEIVFGRSTTTDDSEGQTLLTGELTDAVTDITQAKAVLQNFTGTISQIPPQFSAIKQQGVRAYQQARKGVAVELKAREVSINRLEVEVLSTGVWLLDASVSSGTYVRSLARDVGEAVGCPAHLGKLRRTRIGNWHVDQALCLDDLRQLTYERGFAACLVEPSIVSDGAPGAASAPGAGGARGAASAASAPGAAGTAGAPGTLEQADNMEDQA
ncbi:MAG: tRNA pseudouridine(55) synthase TruB [Coriobacteriia bacterium]|nr:tRNA pseudouridine(55) synthase TruB [Coriobacteriia bacterium]